jgi:hypothetical protein
VSDAKQLVAIDPGDVYVGVAFFDQLKNYNEWTDPDADLGVDDWRCVGATEYTPDQFADDFAESIVASDFDYVVFERFRLYGDKANQQTGSEFQTSQLIGVIKWIVRKQNEHHDAHREAEQKGLLISCEQPGGVCNKPTVVRPVTLVAQMADIKKPTKGILNTRGIKSVARPIAREKYGNRDHVVDAELHGWYYILNGMYGDA